MPIMSTALMLDHSKQDINLQVPVLVLVQVLPKIQVLHSFQLCLRGRD